jgi:hypothetical protein
VRGSGLPQGVDWIDPEGASRGPDAGEQTRGGHHRGRRPKPHRELCNVFRRSAGGSFERDEPQQKDTSGCNAAPHEHHRAGQDFDDVPSGAGRYNARRRNAWMP